MNSSKIFHLEENSRTQSLDALRGVAIVMVFFYHLATMKQLPEFKGSLAMLPAFGMFGVDLFYILSGYFITRALLKSPAWDAPRFLRSRVSRIYPAFLVSLPIFLTLRWLLNLPFDLHLGLGLVLHALMLHNFFPGIGASINGPYWTLGVEFPYYMIMLAVAPFLRQRASYWLCTGLMVLVALTWRSAVFLNYPDEATRFFHATQVFGTLDEFFIGGLAAYLVGHRKWGPWLKENGRLIFSIGLACTLATFYYQESRFPTYWAAPETAILWRTALAGAMSVVIMGCAHWAPTKVLKWTGLPWLGKISYSLYLYHMLPIILRAVYFPEVDRVVALPAMAMASVALAWLSWRHVETRFHKTLK